MKKTSLKYIMSNLGTTTISTSKFQTVDIQALSAYLFPISMLIIIVAIIIKITRDKNALSQKYYLYTFIIIIPIILLSLYVNDAFSQISVAIKQFISILIFVFGCIAVWMYYYQTNSTSIALNYTMFLVFFLLILTTLSIIYTVFMQYIKNINHWAGFFIELIFTLPCYFIDFIQYIISDARSTPPTLLILFVLEIIFLLCYQYVPRYFNKLTRDKTVLVRDPIPLNEEYIVLDSVSTNPIFKNTQSVIKADEIESTSSMKYNTNYSISFWYYLNPENSGGVEKNILYLGTKDKSVKPQVVYKNGGSDADKIVIRVDGVGKEIVLENTGGGQKWNYLVITYDNQKCDVWLNGVLEQTIPGVLAPEIIATDKLVIGETGGKYGFIKNVRYTGIPMTELQIIGEYNLEKGL